MGKPKRRRRRIILSVLLALAVLAACGTGWVLSRQDGYDRNIQRIADALPTASSKRPLPDAGENWLLVGSDMRGDFTETTWRKGEARSDTIMLLHAPKGRDDSYVVSIPRDSWVEIPGHGRAKINASFERGGPRLLVETVEKLTDVRIDHFAAVDFQGFKTMTDALGGVDVHLAEDVYDPSNEWSWEAGKNHMDGDEALRFVRERKGLPGSDFDRVKRQQAFIKAMAEKAASTGVLTDPARLDAFLEAASGAVAVDSGTTMGTMRSLAARMARGGPEGIEFISLPAAETGYEGSQNVVRLDTSAVKDFSAALREDRLDEYIEEHELANDVDKVN
ncbi:LytR family transcriptional attenuator [Murinocardiopsis flavida]|uniref:LytR family transcriptional attenuator n=1 Tax=Murinocardiopsis flavida TaxID=645275 RepID=A0A2P8CZ52_9ACTN|nr:LCP family protein [Murinocardiopsis flavida]PSK90249.1 LytR family transcriptional attenuator [Murinocardiopsis flavida]